MPIGLIYSHDTTAVCEVVWLLLISTSQWTGVTDLLTKKLLQTKSARYFCKRVSLGNNVIVVNRYNSPKLLVGDQFNS